MILIARVLSLYVIDIWLVREKLRPALLDRLGSREKETLSLGDDVIKDLEDSR